MLILGLMHRFGFILMYGVQKIDNRTVFWPTTIFRFGFIKNKYLLI